MLKGVDHVGIAAKALDPAVGRYETIYGASVSDRSEAPAAGRAMAFFRFGDSYIEPVSANGDQGPIAKRLAEQGEGVHLVAMKVDSIDATLTRLRDAGIRLVGDPGAGNPVKGQVFIHPSVTGGVLTQIVER